jgi:acylphosphatase
MAKIAGRRWRVDGRVQGVGFRYFVQHKATALGLAGWARNREDGTVEVQAFGSPERLDDLGAALYVGPRAADVRSVEMEEIEESEPPSGFAIR